MNVNKKDQKQLIDKIKINSKELYLKIDISKISFYEFIAKYFNYIAYLETSELDSIYIYKILREFYH